MDPVSIAILTSALAGTSVISTAVAAVKERLKHRALSTDAELMKSEAAALSKITTLDEGERRDIEKHLDEFVDNLAQRVTKKEDRKQVIENVETFLKKMLVQLGDAASVSAATTFDVILSSLPPDKKIAVIKAVREVKVGLPLAEAKALVEGAPKPVLEGASKSDAEAAKKRLEEAGAKIELK